MRTLPFYLPRMEDRTGFPKLTPWKPAATS